MLKRARATTDGALRSSVLDFLTRLTKHTDDLADDLLQEVTWARTFFGCSAPDSAAGAPEVVQVKFALERDVPQRVAFAASFAQLADAKVDWEALKVFAEATPIPMSMSHKQLWKMVALVAESGLRKWVPNPLVAALVEYRADMSAAFAPGSAASAPVWVAELHRIVAKSRLQVAHWATIPDSFDCSVVEKDHLPALAKALGKLWSNKAPEWVASLRANAKEGKDKEQDKKAEKKQPKKADDCNDDKTTKGDDCDDDTPNKGDDCDGDKAQDDEEEEQQVGSSAPEATISAASAPEFAVGDIVRLLEGAGKRIAKQEAQVTKVMPKTLQVSLLHLQEKPKTVTKTWCQIIQHSTLKSLGAVRVASSPSSSAVVAPDLSAAKAPEISEEECAANLFGDD